MLPVPTDSAAQPADAPCVQDFRITEKRHPFFLLDSNHRRRADICYKLAGIGLFIEPLDDIDEISASSSDYGVVLAEDSEKCSIPELIDCMINSGHWWPVIGFAQQVDTTRIVEAITSGAVNYLQWPCDPATIARAFQAAQANAITTANQKMRELKALSQLNVLTPREREVLSWIAQGYSNHSIADILAISSRTVEIHRANLLRKMGARNTSDAIRIAVEASLLGPSYALENGADAAE